MLSKKEVKTTLKTFHKKQRKARNRLRFLWIFVVVIALFVALDLGLDLGFIQRNFIPNVFILSLLMGLLLLGLFANKLYMRESPTVRYLYPTIVDKLKTFYERDFNYEAYPKQYKDLNKESAMFTRQGIAQVKYVITGKSFKDRPFKLFNLQFIISTGSAATKLFSGLYYIIDHPTDTLFQVRTQGRPSRKGSTYNQLDPQEGFDIFVEVDKPYPLYLDHYVTLLARLKKTLHAKDVFLSSTDTHLHFAYSTKPLGRLKKVNADTLDMIFKTFSLYIERVDDLYQEALFR